MSSLQGESYKQKNYKTFSRRSGKTLTNLSKKTLEEFLPIYQYDFAKFNNSTYKKTFLEIGFGMGEHFTSQVVNNQDSLLIGAEVFINGVARTIKNLKSLEVTNFLIWPDDVDILFEQLPDNSLDGIYILFPDPWPKRRNLKKRLVNPHRLEMMKKKLKNNGFISFASDIADYFQAVVTLFAADPNFIFRSKDFSIPHQGYVKTKYHLKAEKEGRQAQFLTVILQKR
jgi:release factor glutamine methyltransferase